MLRRFSEYFTGLGGHRILEDAKRLETRVLCMRPKSSAAYGMRVRRMKLFEKVNVHPTPGRSLRTTSQGRRGTLSYRTTASWPNCGTLPSPMRIPNTTSTAFDNAGIDFAYCSLLRILSGYRSEEHTSELQSQF